MIAAKIAAALGGAHRSGAWWRCRCPAHGSIGATLALRDGERRLLLKCFGGCHPRDVLDELDSGLRACREMNLVFANPNRLLAKAGPG